MTFYAAAAQIIPVLFLALVVERRFFEPADEALDPSLDLLVLLMFVVGETFSLWALGGGHPGPATRALVATPLVIGGLGVVAPVAGPRLARALAAAGKGRLPSSVDRFYLLAVASALYGIPVLFLAVLWLRAIG